LEIGSSHASRRVPLGPQDPDSCPQCFERPHHHHLGHGPECPPHRQGGSVAFSSKVGWTAIVHCDDSTCGRLLINHVHLLATEYCPFVTGAGPADFPGLSIHARLAELDRQAATVTVPTMVGLGPHFFKIKTHKQLRLNKVTLTSEILQGPAASNLKYGQQCTTKGSTTQRASGPSVYCCCCIIGLGGQGGSEIVRQNSAPLRR
jgi:hypothetical protein